MVGAFYKSVLPIQFAEVAKYLEVLVGQRVDILASAGIAESTEIAKK